MDRLGPHVVGGLEARRHEDGPEVWVERTIAAPVEAVWELVADPATPARFSEELQQAEWLDGATAPAVGARFVGRNARGETTWETTCTVLACEPGRTWSYAVEDVESPVGVWSWGLEPVEGGTRARQHARLGPGRSGLTWAIRQRPDDWERITRARLESLQENMARNLDGLADLLEGG